MSAPDFGDVLKHAFDKPRLTVIKKLPEHIAEKKEKVMGDDGPPPTKYTEDQLSRVEEAIQLLGFINTQVRLNAWHSLPMDLRLEFNKCKWVYRPLRERIEE